jgi:hypothetical protein
VNHNCYDDHMKKTVTMIPFALIERRLGGAYKERAVADFRVDLRARLYELL